VHILDLTHDYLLVVSVWSSTSGPPANSDCAGRSVRRGGSEGHPGGPSLRTARAKCPDWRAVDYRNRRGRARCAHRRDRHQL